MRLHNGVPRRGARVLGWNSNARVAAQSKPKLKLAIVGGGNVPLNPSSELHTQRGDKVYRHLRIRKKGQRLTTTKHGRVESASGVGYRIDWFDVFNYRLSTRCSLLKYRFSICLTIELWFIVSNASITYWNAKISTAARYIAYIWYQVLVHNIVAMRTQALKQHISRACSSNGCFSALADAQRKEKRTTQPKRETNKTRKERTNGNV